MRYDKFVCARHAHIQSHSLTRTRDQGKQKSFLSKCAIFSLFACFFVFDFDSINCSSTFGDFLIKPNVQCKIITNNERQTHAHTYTKFHTHLIDAFEKWISTRWLRVSQSVYRRVWNYHFLSYCQAERMRIEQKERIFFCLRRWSNDRDNKCIEAKMENSQDSNSKWGRLTIEQTSQNNRSEDKRCKYTMQIHSIFHESSKSITTSRKGNIKIKTK